MYPNAERERRYLLLQKMMEEQGLQALLLAGNAEATQRGYIRYVADWRLWGGKGYVVLPAAGAPLLVLGKGSQSFWARELGWIEDVRAAGDLLQGVAVSIESLGLNQAAMGIVGMHEVMPYGDVASLRHHLPEAKWIDATRLVDDIMAVKSQVELREAGKTYRYISEAMDAFEAALVPGKRERAVMAEAVHLLADFGCHDGIAHLTNGTQPFYRPPSDRIITPDDILKVSLEFAGPSGYWMELSGIFSFRDPPARVQRYFDTVTKAHQRAAARLRPGAKGRDLTHAIEMTFQEDGWHVGGRAIWDGHAIGLNVIRPPYGLSESDDEYLENMIINVHPGLMVDADQLGYVMQDNYVVTPQGGRPMGAYEHRWRMVPL